MILEVQYESDQGTCEYGERANGDGLFGLKFEECYQKTDDHPAAADAAHIGQRHDNRQHDQSHNLQRFSRQYILVNAFPRAADVKSKAISCATTTGYLF